MARSRSPRNYSGYSIQRETAEQPLLAEEFPTASAGHPFPGERQYPGKIKMGKRVLLFASLHYWIEQTALLGLTLAGAGHHPHLAYLPYFDWQKPVSKFDLRRNNLYARDVLEEQNHYLQIHIPAGLSEKEKLTCRTGERNRNSQLL